MLSLSIRKLCTHSQSSYGVYTLQAHVRFKISNFHKRSFFHAYTLRTCLRIHSPYSYLVYTLQAHVRFKISNFHERSFFHAYTLHTCFRIHSPYSYLVYTLQAHVRFKIFKFSREIIFSCLHSPHMFQGSLSIQMLHFKMLYSHYIIMCLNAPLNHECLTP